MNHHIVQPGDGWNQIAAKVAPDADARATVAKMRAANTWVGKTLHPGMVLHVPGVEVESDPPDSGVDDQHLTVVTQATDPGAAANLVWIDPESPGTIAFGVLDADGDAYWMVAGGGADFFTHEQDHTPEANAGETWLRTTDLTVFYAHDSGDGATWVQIARNGEDGENGEDGIGFPPGGFPGQVLVKASTANNDNVWADQSGSA